jgi:hypothetical protein
LRPFETVAAYDKKAKTGDSELKRERSLSPARLRNY